MPARRGARQSVGRYTSKPPDTARDLGAPSVAIRTRVATVANPYGGKQASLVNTRTDLLEIEHAAGRLSVAAYNEGRIAQAVLEQMSSCGGSSWDMESRGDGFVAKELKILAGVERARRCVMYVDGLQRAGLGRTDIRLLRNILGERKTFAQCAAMELRFGDRGRRYIAERFRDALEELATARAARGKVRRDELDVTGSDRKGMRHRPDGAEGES